MPFYLRTGKRLPRRVTEIGIVFRKAPHLPFARSDTVELGANQLVVRVQPDEGVTLRFGSKVPGTTMEVRDVSMDFSYGEAFTENSPEAYERLLLDVLLGDSTLFPRNEEVEASWRVIDPIEQLWREGGAPEPYRAGEWGPRPPTTMLARDGRTWRRPDGDPLGHQRICGGEGAGGGAPAGRRGRERAGPDAGRRRRRAAGRRGGAGRHRAPRPSTPAGCSSSCAADPTPRSPGSTPRSRSAAGSVLARRS